MDQSSPKPLDRHTFDQAYDDHIIGRSFVEYKDYYHQSRERFWQSLKYFENLSITPESSILDIGGGQFGILAKELFGLSAAVGDVVNTAADDVRASDLSFETVNLFAGEPAASKRYDAVSLLEVIEHIPKPPYLVLDYIKSSLLKPNGYVFLTTPNGLRIRNTLYMLFGKEVLDIYRYPEGDEALGHQHEYTLKQMVWQFEKAGFDVLLAETYEDGFKGARLSARLAHMAVKPLTVVPHFRNSLVFAAKAL